MLRPGREGCTGQTTKDSDVMGKAAGAAGGKKTVDSKPSPTRWADDTRRGLGAVGLAVIAGGVALVVTDLTNLGGTVGDRMSMATAMTLLTTYVVLLGAYAAHTWVLFSGMEPAELESAIRTTTPQTAKERRRQKKLATGPAAWLQMAAGLALLAVAVLIVTDRLRSNPALIVGSLALVVVAWVLMAVSGTLLLVREDLGHTAGRSLVFPDDGPHRWTDYTYLAIQICTTFSSSDVSVTTTRMRRAVTSLAITAFLFNTVIVALLVSVLLSVG